MTNYLEEMKTALETAMSGVIATDQLEDLSEYADDALLLRVGYTNFALNDPELNYSGTGTLSITVNMRGTVRKFTPHSLHERSPEVVAAANDLGWLLESISFQESDDYYEQDIFFSRPTVLTE